MKTRLLAAAAIVLLAAPATSQTILDRLIQRIGKPKAQDVAATQTGSASQSVAVATPTQRAAIDRLLAATIQDQRVVKARDQAVGLIRVMLVSGSCARTVGAWNGLNRQHLTPKNYTWSNDLARVPMMYMHYHDQTRCLDVVRLTNWAMPAANALRFTAYYVADDSGEARNQTFELQKTAEAEWLIRDVGTASN